VFLESKRLLQIRRKTGVQADVYKRQKARIKNKQQDIYNGKYSGSFGENDKGFGK
jgi:hypothetical protein